jgi:putative transposase
LGFYVSLDAPSLVSVAMVLTHAVLPKEHWLADRELEVPWPMAGIPDVLHLDYAPEFDSELLRRGAQEYGMRIEHRPAGKPHFGGHIERLIGTMMGAVHLLPGTTFSNVAEETQEPPQAPPGSQSPRIDSSWGSRTQSRARRNHGYCALWNT